MLTFCKLHWKGSPSRSSLARHAQHALAERKSPLIAEMDSYFSCLARLRVRFYESDPEGTATPVNPHLHIRFRPVITARCDLQEVEGKPPLVDAPLVKRFPFVPRWLQLDFKRGLWMGEFGHTEMA
jgi:hypothetical protein